MTFTTRVPRPDQGAALVTQAQNARSVTPGAPTRVCLVGAGAIAATHAEALASLPDVQVAALVEPNPARAEKFAKKWKIGTVHADLPTALAAGGFEAVHILTPPDTHAELTQQCIDAGVAVLVEKPVATRLKEAEALAASAQACGVVAAVNQNFVFHPAFARLRKEVGSGKSGPLRDIHVAYNVPLRQLAARQFGAWMFAEPGNILLEQAVHPLSQVLSLVGPIEKVQASARPGARISKDFTFHGVADAILTTRDCGIHLQFAVGRAFPFWQITAICDDAVLVADILNNRFHRIARGPGLEPVDAVIQAVKSATQLAAAGVVNACDYVLSLLRLAPRSDAFYRSMHGSIGAFHRAVRAQSRGGLDQPTDLAFGSDIVAVCAEIARQCFGPSTRIAPPLLQPNPLPPADVAVLGGTGFIGSATTARLAAAGYKVRVMARNTRNLGDVFSQPGVTLMRGDITRKEDVAAAVSGVPVVINLAHGGGGETFAEIERALVGGARTVAEACLAAGVTQLIHVGSIAGLYLGGEGDIVTGATPPDPHSAERADYARAKADADRMLMNMHREQGLPITILRPGVVVGEGTSPFHSGLGMFNNDQHCVGWNEGANALPFVLVDDVAAAIASAVGRNNVLGKAYNLVGDVRIDARSYIAALAEATGRPLRFHPSRVTSNYLADLGKWLLKRVGGRATPLPSLRDIRSRGLVAGFDCTDAARDLEWHPVSEREQFLARAFAGIS